MQSSDRGFNKLANAFTSKAQAEFRLIRVQRFIAKFLLDSAILDECGNQIFVMHLYN